MIRRLGLMLVMAGSLFAISTPVGAGEYIFSCGFLFDPPVIQPGGTVHILGSQFTPGGTATFFIDDVSDAAEPVFLGSADVDDDAEGNIDVTFDLPAAFDVDGEYTITVECPEGDVASNILIVGVGQVTTTTAPILVPTGSNSTTDMVRIGAGLLAVGGLVLVLSRRRATLSTTA